MTIQISDHAEAREPETVRKQMEDLLAHMKKMCGDKMAYEFTLGTRAQEQFIREEFVEALISDEPGEDPFYVELDDNNGTVFRVSIL